MLASLFTPSRETLYFFLHGWLNVHQDLADIYTNENETIKKQQNETTIDKN